MIYDIEPCSKPRQTRSDKWKKRPCVLKYRAFKDECRLKRVIIPQPCEVIFNVAMPNSWSDKKKRELQGSPHLTRPDLDNLLKGLMDAVLDEDSMIWNVHAKKIWAYKSNIEVR